MPHILNTTQAIIDALNKHNTASISAKVLLYAKGYKITSVVGGIFTYDTSETENHCFDVSNAVNNESIVINKTIPELPTFNGEAISTQYGAVKIQLKKIYGDFWQFVGQGAGITDISSMLFEIYAKTQNVPDIPVYTGKVNLTPTETFDTVTYDIESSLWDMIDKELCTNQYGTHAYSDYGSGIITETNNSYIGVSTPFQNITYYHPVLYFNEHAILKALVDAKDNAVDIYSVNLNTTKNAKLGKYTLKWDNHYTVTLTTPVFKSIKIVHTPILASGYLDIDIPLAYQDEIGINKIIVYVTNPQEPNPFTDIRNKTVDFYLSFTVKGNPISIVLDMIIRSYTNTWNNSAVSVLDPALPIDYDRFLELEESFSFVKLYINEWNKSNEKFRYGSNEKPLQVKNIAQKVLDHIGCQLTFDTQGRISINTNWYYNESQLLQRIGSNHVGSIGAKVEGSHTISGTQPFNSMELYYGTNEFTESVGKPIESFAAEYFISTKANVYKVTLPYYKLGVSDLIVEQINAYLWKWVMLSHIRLSANVLPQFGITLDVGDKFIADFNLAPILPNVDKSLAKYFMIYSISKKIGGIVTIQCMSVPEPILPCRWCETNWCGINSRFK